MRIVLIACLILTGALCYTVWRFHGFHVGMSEISNVGRM